MTASRTEPRSFKTVWLLIGALIFLGGVSWWVTRSILQSRQAAQEEASQPPPRQVQVVALGRLEPEGRVVDVAASDSGRISRIVVEEGDRVEANQVLAYLDLYEVRLAERDYAASQLSEAQSILAAETQAGESRIREAATRIDQIDRPQAAAIAAQTSRIEGLKAELNLAQLDLSRFRQLYENGAIPRQDLDRQQADVDRLKAELASAEASKLQLQQARVSDLNNAEAQVGSAQASLTLAQAQTGVDSAARNLALAEEQLERTLIRAPRAGQVLRLYVEPGEAVSNLEGSPVLALGNTEQMYVVAEVHETDVEQVEVGQPATITSRNGAFDQTLSGTVEQVGLQIFKNDVLDDDPAANADARVVEVRIRLDPDDSQVVAGLTNLQVDVAIDIEATTQETPSSAEPSRQG